LNANAKRVLVTGGSGFVGINLVRDLVARGYAVTSYDVMPFDYPDMRDRITEIQADIRDAEAVDRATSGHQFVVHAAAALPRHKPRDILSIDIDGTRNVLDAARRHGVARVVHLSTTAVYGIPDHAPLLESDPVHPLGPYGDAKVAAEALCAEYRAHGRVVSVLRPVAIIGPERLGVFAILFDWAMDRRHFPLIGSGANRYQFVHVADLCQAIVACMTLAEEMVDETFNVGARDFGTMRDDYQAVLDAAGFGRRIIAVPAAPMIWSLRILERMRLSPIYRWIYESADRDAYVSIEKAERQLGFVPRYSNADALISNFEWYRGRRAKVDRRPGVSHREAWAQGALSIVKHLF
jgi:nucleoside-diphosphate-sugar epimerase